MSTEKYWLYSSIEELIDMEIMQTTEEEHDRTDVTSLGNDSPESSTEHTE